MEKFKIIKKVASNDWNIFGENFFKKKKKLKQLIVVDFIIT